MQTACRVNADRSVDPFTVRGIEVAADVMVQEYGGILALIRVACEGVVSLPKSRRGRLHGFLSYLVKCNLERQSSRSSVIRKQVGTNIHSYDVARFIHEFISAPRSGRCTTCGAG